MAAAEGTSCAPSGADGSAAPSIRVPFGDRDPADVRQRPVVSHGVVGVLIGVLIGVVDIAQWPVSQAVAGIHRLSSVGSATADST